MDLDQLNFVKFCNKGLLLGSSQFTLLFQQPQKIMIAAKLVKNDPKLIILLVNLNLRHTMYCILNFYLISTAIMDKAKASKYACLQATSSL
jgi:hypothetical protein